MQVDWSLSNYDHIVSEDLDLFFEGHLLLHLAYAVIGISHDRDQHVQECDLHKEGRQDKNDPHDNVFAFKLVIH